jgi:sterol desaturase/sphingolipid hydroxylase (fatty acid hydroxylase superfamily)
MPSLRSVRAYLTVNSFLISLASVQYVVHSTNISATNQVIKYMTFLLRNFLLLTFVEALVGKRPLLAPTIVSSQNTNTNIFAEVVQASFIEHMTYLCILCIRSFQPSVISQNTKMHVYEMLSFIPLSFMFEVAFDFFHYWTHRVCHLYPWLYKQTHKIHHEHSIVSPNTTYHQHYLDIILTNSVPFILTYVLFPFSLSLWQLHMMLVYKEFVEISGHCGRVLYPASSFPQFIWLSRLLRISLYAEDHHIHHTKRIYNFGKRFSIWDKVFNTYHCGVTKKQNKV